MPADCKKIQSERLRSNPRRTSKNSYPNRNGTQAKQEHHEAEAEAMATTMATTMATATDKTKVEIQKEEEKAIKK